MSFQTQTTAGPATGKQVTIDLSDIPATGTWQIDPSHSSVEFSARHLMVSKVRGQFSAFAGTLEVRDPIETSSVDVTIDASSITTHNEQRDAHLVTPDFLDAGNFKDLTFKSTSVKLVHGREFILEGDLTIKGVARPVTVQAEFSGLTDDPWGNERAAFVAVTEIDREDWGITWNQALEAGGVLVSRKIKIELDITAIKQK